MRPSEESEKVLEKNTPYEGRKAESACPCLGHAKDRPKHGFAPKATPLETQ